MIGILNKPMAPIDQIAALVEQDSPALANFVDDSFSETHCLRHDGWNGQKVARFCEVLAETGIWREWRTEEWRTDFLPPPGFTGLEQADWED